MKLLLIILFSLSTFQITSGQTIKGQLTGHRGQNIQLIGFNYHKSYVLKSTVIDSLGYFDMNYSDDYYGMGVLKTDDGGSIVVSLTEKFIYLEGTKLQDLDTLVFENSPHNEQFLNFAIRNMNDRRALQGWLYLQPIYASGKTTREERITTILLEELKRIEQADSISLKRFKDLSYLDWFLPKQLLVNSMTEASVTNKERLMQNINAFYTIDFKDPKFQTSGLFKQLLEGHYMLIEHMGEPLDSVYSRMNFSINYLYNVIKDDDFLINLVFEHLFDYFEKRSLFEASNYLAVTLLSDSTLQIEKTFANKMEKYFSLKVGNIAPDIKISDTLKLSSIQKTVLLVFGASSCPQCKVEATELMMYYDQWNATQKDIEVVYISLDTDRTIFNEAYKHIPWRTYSDFKGWESPAAISYHINGTPTYFLLSPELKIELFTYNLNQINSWIEINL